VEQVQMADQSGWARCIIVTQFGHDGSRKTNKVSKSASINHVVVVNFYGAYPSRIELSAAIPSGGVRIHFRKQVDWVGVVSQDRWKYVYTKKVKSIDKFDFVFLDAVQKGPEAIELEASSTMVSQDPISVQCATLSIEVE